MISGRLLAILTIPLSLSAVILYGVEKSEKATLNASRMDVAVLESKRMISVTLVWMQTITREYSDLSGDIVNGPFKSTAMYLNTLISLNVHLLAKPICTGKGFMILCWHCKHEFWICLNS